MVSSLHSSTTFMVRTFEKKSVVNFVFIDNTFLNIDLTVDGRDKTAALGIEEGGGSKITKL